MSHRILSVPKQMFHPVLLPVFPKFPSVIKRQGFSAHNVCVVRILCQFPQLFPEYSLRLFLFRAIRSRHCRPDQTVIPE